MSYAEAFQNVTAAPGTQPWRHTLRSFRGPLQVSFRHILYATDLSAAADNALPYAVEIARRSLATVHAVHVVPADVYPEFLPAEWAEIARANEEFRTRKSNEIELELQDLPHEFLMLHGDAAERIAEVARDKDADLIVLGTHGRTGIVKAFMGSVAERIYRQASCPVLLVGPQVPSGARHAAAAEFNCILYATDFSPESLAAARYAISIARDHRAGLVLLHTAEPRKDETEEISLETLRNVVPLGAGLWSPPTCIVERDEPANAILQAARKNHADLIVLGARDADRHLTAATHLANSIASRVIAAAPCPVFTVHG